MDPRQELAELEELARLEEKAKVPSVPRQMLDSVLQAGRAAYSGAAKGASETALLPYKGLMGLGLAGAGGIDALFGTNIREPFEQKLAQAEAPIRNAPGTREANAVADREFTDPKQRYIQQITAGAVGGVAGPGALSTTGMVTGALGGGAAEAASQAGLHPALQMLAAVVPAFSVAGWKAIRDPIAVQQIKQAMAATTPDEVAKAQQLIATAKARGVELSPAQAFGQNHPLVPLLEQVGRSAGGSNQVKIFLGAQDAPTNTLTNQVTNAFGQTDAQTAADVVSKRAAGIRAGQEKAPGRLAAPYYKAAEVEPLPPSVVDDLVTQLRELQGRVGKNTPSFKYIDGKIRELSDGTKTVEQVKMVLGDDNFLKLVKELQEVDVPIDTYGKLKNIRDASKVDYEAVPMAGTGADGVVPKNIKGDVASLVREASKTSPNLSAADALFSARMKRLEKLRMGPLTQLAGPQMRDSDAASNFARVTQFLDPARNAPKKIDRVLSQLTDSDEKVVQQLTAGYLRNATERARRSEGYAPAQIETLLRGGEGSGRRDVLEALIRRSIGEQNRANRLDPLDPQQFVDNLMANLDVMEATGRGRGALTSVENIPRVAAQLDTPVQLARGSSANIVSQTPSLIRFSEHQANKKLAGTLTDPSMQKLLEMRDYDRLALISELLRRALQTSVATGD